MITLISHNKFHLILRSHYLITIVYVCVFAISFGSDTSLNISFWNVFKKGTKSLLAHCLLCSNCSIAFDHSFSRSIRAAADWMDRWSDRLTQPNCTVLAELGFRIWGNRKGDEGVRMEGESENDRVGPLLQLPHSLLYRAPASFHFLGECIRNTLTKGVSALST